ncbi:hypothetical protein XENOCAPTIV_012982, partial [Xenoophorus captivus]
MRLQRSGNPGGSVRLLYRTVSLQGWRYNPTAISDTSTTLYGSPHSMHVCTFYLQENVQGSRCDQCRIGTFHLDPTNPKGCTSCFCFGATDRCQSSDKRRVEVMDMDGWVLLGADRQEVPVTVYPDQDLVEADLSDVPDVYQDLHWHAPKTYLGDKGNQMTLVFMEREYLAPEDPHLGIVHIVEVTTGTLSDYSLENVFPVTVTDTRTNVWMDLESVWCAPGFYGNPMVLGSRCQPCHCNGNTDPNMLFTDCHPLTGQCLSCMHNTAGPHCDVCAPGYYGDAIHTKNCTKCQCSPCGTESCDRHTGQCRCKPGVTGLLCDHCQLVIENYNTTLDESRNRANMLDLDIVANNADIDDLLRKAMLREMRYRSCVGQKKLADKEKSEAEKLLDRVNMELANRQEENLNLTQAIRDRLLRFRSEMIDLRDALNEAVNNTARAAELNSVNEKTLEKHNRKIEDLLMKLKEVNDTMDMAVADVTQVNTEYERLAAQLDGARSPLAKKVQTLAGTNSLIPLVEEAEKHAELLNALAMNLTRGFDMKNYSVSHIFLNVLILL